mgnify:FL=1
MGVWQNLKMRFSKRSGYDSGSFARGGENWTPVDGRAEDINVMSRDTIRHRARDLERNADYVEAAILAMERNVVGSGIRLDCKLEDTDLEQKIENLWERWCHAENCDVTGRLCFCEILKMAVRRMMVDGGLLLVATYTGNKNFPLQLQIKEVDELNSGILFHGKNQVVGGIEIDASNRPVAYHFTVYDVYGETGKIVRIPADRVIYLNRIKRTSQVREVSSFANVLSRLRDLNQFLNAVSVKERMLACLAVFVKKVNAALGLGRNQKVDKETGAKKRKLSPGMIMELDAGDEIQVVNPSGQASNAKDMVSILLRAVSSAMGLSYEAVSRDMSQSNYSSARQNLIEDRETYKEWQHYLSEHLCRKVYRWWLDSCVMAGGLSIPDYFSAPEKYTECQWIAKGMSWIDPAKEANANRIAMATYQTTLEEVAAEQGKDWREILAQRAREEKLMKELGLEVMQNVYSKETTHQGE